ncbi:MAG: glycoside hydrolase family 99-like domain-containing protein [Nitrospirota bacterium]
MNIEKSLKNKLRYFLVHVPRVSLDIIRTQGVRPLLEKIGRYLRQTLHAGKLPVEPGREKRAERRVEEKNRKRRRVNGKTKEAYVDYLFEKSARGPEYVPISYPDLPETDIKLIAFYLPQFHPIPENDEWWGKGFTEWTNVTRALPQFVGHYQPKLPGELGFYDLRVKEVQRRQVELAKQYGLHGFCFYFYWFAGKTLLEKPLEQFLSDSEMDFPFCICWANENWTRRWDGMDQEILYSQKHSPEDDIAFIEHVSKYLKDERYIRINSKPLLVVYRQGLLPEPAKTAERWRQWCRENGIGEIYLAVAHSFDWMDPRDIGFDAAIEFTPNTYHLKDITYQFDIINDKFEGKILDYNDAIEVSKDFVKPPYLKFRCLCPGWDNDARMRGKGATLANSTPEAYKEWLRYLCDYTTKKFPRDERHIFVNAWNEWAEGAYLEPDRKYGYAYLAATAEVLSSFPTGINASHGRWKVLFVSHDAYRAGAQSVLLDVISWLKRHTYIDPKILCLEGGEWLNRFKALGETLVLSDLKKKRIPEEYLAREIEKFCGGRPDLIYGNSVAAGQAYRLLHHLGAPVITHFHELEMSIERYAADWVGDVLKYSLHFIACSEAVRENLVKNHGIDRSKISMAYSSIQMDSSVRIPGDKLKHHLRKKLEINESKFLVFGCGRGMAFRKGADLFIKVARALHEKGFDNFHFYWIGDFEATQCDEKYGIWAGHIHTMKKEGADKYVTFLGIKDNPREYLQAGDVFTLTSREDPFPLVALEAAECGLPVICFADAGGMPEFVEEDAGFVVPYEDVEAMADRIADLMKDNDLRQKLGARGREKLLSRFTFDHALPQVLSACRKAAGKKPAVSVIVPNYNHARYLPERLDSIFNQTFKDFEVILLDDASTDDSMGVLEKYADRPGVSLIRNESNSGSPFKQWLKGIELARADILWIAESDDVSDPRFLEALLPSFGNPEVRLAYTDSHIIDEDGIAGGGYSDSEYLVSLSESKWKRGYENPAAREINDGLGVKNTVLNVSAALYRKFEVNDVFRSTIQDMRIAGDWYFAVNAIRGGRVHYDARRLNYHRRHSQSVIGKTISDKKVEDFFREFYMVQKFIYENYELDESFAEKWESYLRKQWNDFYPGRPFEELEKYYPINKMKEKIKRGSIKV